MTRVDEAAGRIRGEFNAHPMLIGAMVVCGCLLGAVARAAERGPDSAGTMDAVARLATAGVSALSTDSFVGDSAYRWHTFYGAITADRAYGVAVDGAGNVYITGRSRSTWNGPTGQPPLHDHSDSGTAPDIVVLKLNSSGAYQWHTFYGTSGTDNSADYGYAVAIDGSTDVYVTGFSYGSWNGPAGQPPKHAYSGSQDQSSNAFVLKLDQWGAYQWHTFYGSATANDYGLDVAFDSGANVYAAGRSLADWSGDAGALPLHQYSGGVDIMALKLDDAGAYQWHTFYGSAADDYGQDIAIDSRDKIHVAGYSKASWLGDADAPPLHAYTGGDDIVDLALFLPAPTPTPTPTPAPTPIPLNLIVNKPAFNATDRITITADLTVGGTPYAGRPCYPYVRFLTPDSRYYYLTGSGALVPDRKTPYATGRDGGPMMFFADVQGYPVFSAGFSNVATGTYRLQGALVDAGCNIMGTMADRVLSVGSVTPTPAPPTPSPTATTAPTPTAAPSPI